MTNSIPTAGPETTGCMVTMMASTTRTSWMANNAIPDSIIMNTTFRSLEPSVEPNEPNARSTEVGLNSKNTLRIFNTIKPVVRAFTTIVVAKPASLNVFPQGAITRSRSCSAFVAPSAANHIARGDKLKSAFQMEIDLLTYVCDCQE